VFAVAADRGGDRTKLIPGLIALTALPRPVRSRLDDPPRRCSHDPPAAWPLLASAARPARLRPAPLPRKPPGAVEQLDLTGTWEFVRWEEDGKSRPGPIQGWQGEAVGERFNFVSSGCKHRGIIRCGLHPKGESARHRGAETNAPAARYYGSYRLSGGELTMIIAKGGTFAGRPQDFGGKVRW